MSSSPIFTDSVNQSFFIEAQGGPQNPVSYLDRFPNTVYSKAFDSVLVTFLYALVGPGGAGLLRKEYLEARLAIEDAFLNTVDLDTVYTNPFGFARLAQETYTTDASASLLSALERAQILAGDAGFRNRAIDFLKGIRAGGTSLGLSLVAKSGLNHSVELIENYRALYDQYSDDPLNLPYMGSTTSLNEVIVLPRQEAPQSTEQTLVLRGEPTAGWFTLTFPRGPEYQVVQVGLTTGSNVITVPDATQIPAGVYVSITNVPTSSTLGVTAPTIYAQAGAMQSPTSIALIYPKSSGTPGQDYAMGTTGNYWAYVGASETVPLAYNSSSLTIQAALQALTSVNGNNVLVTGGPLPDQPVMIEFTNDLADQTLPEIQTNLQPLTPAINGIGGPSALAPLVSQMTDVTNTSDPVAAVITVDTVGASSDGQTTSIPPINEHAMQVAVDQIRPTTSIITTQSAPPVTKRIRPNTIFSGSTYAEVIRYETGGAGIAWPTVDKVHWLQEGVEKEAPRPVGDLSHHYQGFHNLQSVYSYTEAALADPNYSLINTVSPFWITYWDTHIGPFSPAQSALYPLLDDHADPSTQFSPSYAIAVPPEPLILTDTIDGTGVLNGIYPADYLGIPGVQALASQPLFWASLERAPDISGAPTIDFIEIDLGATQAVNYIYFEATNKPYSIQVAYDVLDQPPARRFAPVALADFSQGNSITNLVYNATNTNPWTPVEVHFTDNLGQMIFARYLRIGFTKTPANSPFAPQLSPLIPYSIEMRNLRVGRNLGS